MARDRVGRNDPCPCGSGKKYKKCCLGNEDAVASGTAEPGGSPQAGEMDRVIVDEMDADLQQLGQWSAGAREAFGRGEYEQAERLSRKIQERWPDLIEGPSMLAKLKMTQGRWAEAAEAYSYAIQVIEGEREAFDDSVLAEMQRGLEEARSKMQS